MTAAICSSGKVGHKTAAKAAKHRKSLQRQGGHEPYCVYRCAECGEYHVGRRRKDVWNPSIERAVARYGR